MSNRPWTPEQRDYLARMMKTIATSTGTTVRERINRMVDESQASLDEGFEACKSYVDREFEALEARIKELESRPAFKYCGVWSGDQQHENGNFVTHGGNLWACKKQTRTEPGTSDAWQLAVKKGRDAR